MRAAAFFDMDGALLEGESQFAFAAWRLGRRMGAPLGLASQVAESGGRFIGRVVNAMQVRASGFAFLRNTPVARFEEMSVEFFETVLLCRFRRGAAALVESHREQGHMTVLVTSACEPLARPVAAWLRVDALIATQLLAGNGRYVCTREWPEPRGMGKRHLVRRFCAERNIPSRDCYAYGNSRSDGPVLDFVGHPVAINPTRQLRRVAQSRGWPVIDLTGTG
jgi:HAD superfamily hydrolase (TIGR01490 family)